MIKILSAAQIKELDKATITKEPISSIDLMERASRAFVSAFILKFNAAKKIGVVCGTGNNGGDGLAVARILLEHGYQVKVFVVRGSVNETGDFKTNFTRLQSRIEIGEIVTESDKGLFTDIDVLIDGVFGSGLSRPATGIYAQVINCINQSEAIKVSIDIPSGLMADAPSTGAIVEADFTISFQTPKLSFFLPQSFAYTGRWEIVDIGLQKEFIRDASTRYFYVTRKSVSRLVRHRSKFDHKGTFGHALIVAGSYGKMGAAVLASRAALRSGAGLVTAHIPKCGYEIMQSSLPEAMVDIDAEYNFFTGAFSPDRFSSLGIGPGLGKHEDTVKGLEQILQTFRKPSVIDADALNIISEHRHLRKHITAGSILTPHPKEFERLVGSWKDDFEKLEKLTALSAELQAVVVLKGAFSAIAEPSGQIYFNSTGNPAMATGGTGDVLTGILTGLLAQSYSSTEAAILGVYLHGLAGDLVAMDRGDRGLLASDLVDMVTLATKRVING